MKKSINFWLLLSAFLLRSFTCFSQQNNCDGVLIPDTRNINNEYEWAQVLINIFESNHIETYDDFRNFMAKASIPIADLPIDASTNNSSSSFREFRDHLYKYNSLNLESRTRINESLKALSNAAIAAWENCQNQRGFRIWLLQGVDPRSFTIVAKYRGQGNANLRSVGFDKPVSTAENGCFTDKKLRTNRRFSFDDGLQFQSFRRLSNESIRIDVNPLQSRSGDGLHIELPPISSDASFKLLILPGQLNYNGTARSTYVPSDETSQFHHSWHDLPIETKGPELTNKAGFAVTSAQSVVDFESSTQYRWSLNIHNSCGGRSGPSGSGGFGYVTNTYSTIIALPPQQNDKSSWTLKMRGSCNVDKNAEAIGKMAIVTLSGKDVDTTFQFVIDRNISEGRITLKDLRPGYYSLTLKMPEMGGGSSGARLGTEEASVAINFATNLYADISANVFEEVSEEKSDSNWSYLVVGIVIVLVIVLFLVFKKKGQRS